MANDWFVSFCKNEAVLSDLSHFLNIPQRASCLFQQGGQGRAGTSSRGLDKELRGEEVGVLDAGCLSFQLCDLWQTNASLVPSLLPEISKLYLIIFLLL